MHSPGRAHLFALLLPLAACASNNDADSATPDPDDSAPLVDEAPVLTVDEVVRTAEDVVRVSGSVVDDRDAAFQLSLVVSADGEEPIAIAIAADGTFSTPLVVPGATHVLTVSATDTAGHVTSDSLVVTEEASNAPPSQPEVHIDPADAASFDTLTVAFDTDPYDPEGLTLTYTYGWALDGASFHEYEVVEGYGVFRGQVWVVEVTANDGTQDGPTGTATVTIRNALPSVTDVTVGPADATVETPLTCTVSNASDAEGDPLVLTYAWTVDGVAAGDGTDTLPAGAALPGQDVVCTATVDDGYDAVPFESAAFQIGAAR